MTPKRSRPKIGQGSDFGNICSTIAVQGMYQVLSQPTEYQYFLKDVTRLVAQIGSAKMPDLSPIDSRPVGVWSTSTLAWHALPSFEE